MSQATTVKEVLMATKWILQHVGWTQGAAYRDVEGRVFFIDRSCPETVRRVKSCCLSGAIGLVQASPELRDEVHQYLGRMINGVVIFNDNLYTTKDKVMALLDKAIGSCQ